MTYNPVIVMTAEEARTLFVEELAKAYFDPIEVLERIASKMHIGVLEVLVNGILPVEWEATLLPHAWAFNSNYTSMYAGTDTFVRLFERVGFVSDTSASQPTEFMTIFRGTTDTPRRLARGLSWTTDLEKARWFSHRFDHLLNPRLGIEKSIRPTVWSAEIPPDGILALFYAQGETEVVVNPRRLRKLQLVEQTEPVWSPDQEDSGIVGIFD